MEIKSQNDIYIKNAQFEMKIIDFSDQKVQEKIIEITKQQEEILERKNIDVDKLHEIVQL